MKKLIIVAMGIVTLALMIVKSLPELIGAPRVREESTIENEQNALAKAMIRINGERKNEPGLAEKNTSLSSPGKETNQNPNIEDIQVQIKLLTDAEVEQKIKEIKNNIYETDLIERLNKNEVSFDERNNAHNVLARLSLLGIEKAERELAHLEPKLSNALYSHREKLSHMRDLLKD